MSDLQQDIANLSPERRRLLELLRRKQEMPDQAPIGRIRPGRGENVFPLSLIQQRFWRIAQLRPGNINHNMLMALRLAGSLDKTALTAALNEIIRRHETLRTTFTTLRGDLVQVVAPALALAILTTDLTALPATDREGTIQRLVMAAARQPFDLTQGPLMRAALLRLSAEEHVAILVMHHMISDGWSQSVLLRELTVLYHAFLAGQALSLPELPIQYADYVLWQRQWLHSTTFVSYLRYWQQQLADLPVVHLPTDKPRSTPQPLTRARRFHVLSSSLTAALHQLSQREGATMFMILLTAFHVLLARHSGQDDIVVGTAVANRSRAEVEGLIGAFVNTLLLRTTLPGNPTFREALHHVREVMLAAYAHQDLPFEKLIETLQPECDPGTSPLYNVAFIFHNTPPPVFKLHSLEIEQLATEHATSDQDLLLSIVEIDRSLRLRVEYNAELFEAARIERLVLHYQALLEGSVADPEQRIRALPRASAAVE